MATFTYDPSTDRGMVRLLIADTRAESGIFTDAEVDAALSRQGTPEGAVYELAAYMYAASIRHTSNRSRSSSAKSETVNDTHQPAHWLALMREYRPFAAATRRLPSVTPVTSNIPSDDGFNL